MRAPDDSGGPLSAALDELSSLAGDDGRAALDALRGRLAGQRLRVLVAGEAKRGKSTLVNALLGRPLLPVGVTPLTALATTVRYGRDEGVSAVFRGGSVRSFPLAALGELVTERGNPGNRLNLVSVTVVADAPVLARGVELVDTPGTGLLAGAIRRRLPGEAGRRRARAYLHREAASLVPQQIGRARADLQYRLAEATRQLTRAVASRYAEGTGRLHSALRAAATVRAATADDADQLDSELAGRQQALSHVLALLDQVTAGATPAGGPDPAPVGSHDAVHPAPGR